MMGKTKKVIKLLRVNWHTMAWFELLYKFLSLAVFTPLCWTAFNGIMRITGYEYLTIENILSFLTNPVTIAALFLLLAAMTVYTMIDIGAVIFLLDQSYQGVKADLQQTCRYAVRNAVKVFHRKNIFIAFAVLFLIPFLNRRRTMFFSDLHTGRIVRQRTSCRSLRWNTFHNPGGSSFPGAAPAQACP